MAQNVQGQVPQNARGLPYVRFRDRYPLFIIDEMNEVINMNIYDHLVLLSEQLEIFSNPKAVERYPKHSLPIKCLFEPFHIRYKLDVNTMAPIRRKIGGYYEPSIDDIAFVTERDETAVEHNPRIDTTGILANANKKYIEGMNLLLRVCAGKLARIIALLIRPIERERNKLMDRYIPKLEEVKKLLQQYKESQRNEEKMFSEEENSQLIRTKENFQALSLAYNHGLDNLDNALEVIWASISDILDRPNNVQDGNTYVFVWSEDELLDLYYFVTPNPSKMVTSDNMALVDPRLWHEKAMVQLDDRQREIDVVELTTVTYYIHDVTLADQQRASGFYMEKPKVLAQKIYYPEGCKKKVQNELKAIQELVQNVSNEDIEEIEINFPGTTYEDIKKALSGMVDSDGVSVRRRMKPRTGDTIYLGEQRNLYIDRSYVEWK